MPGTRAEVDSLYFLKKRSCLSFPLNVPQLLWRPHKARVVHPTCVVGLQETTGRSDRLANPLIFPRVFNRVTTILCIHLLLQGKSPPVPFSHLFCQLVGSCSFIIVPLSVPACLCCVGGSQLGLCKGRGTELPLGISDASNTSVWRK